MVIPILMRFYSLVSNLRVVSRIKPHKGTCHPTKCDVINDIKLFPTAYRRIYCCKFLMLPNQTSHYKIKCIRMPNNKYFGINTRKHVFVAVEQQRRRSACTSVQSDQRLCYSLSGKDNWTCYMVNLNIIASLCS